MSLLVFPAIPLAAGFMTAIGGAFSTWYISLDQKQKNKANAVFLKHLRLYGLAGYTKEQIEYIISTCTNEELEELAKNTINKTKSNS